MSIHRLPVFIAAARNLNFTKAAEELCISQTAISQQIKQLEQELGFELFIRSKRGVQLTPAGEAFYRRCEKISTQYNNAVALAEKIASGQETDLRIGYVGAYELWSIADQVREYHKKFPKAEISFSLGSNSSVIKELVLGKLDLAVLCSFGVELSPGLMGRVTSTEPCMLMISAEHPLAKQKVIKARDLKGIPIVVNRAQDNRSSASQIAGMYFNMGLGNNKRIYADDFYSLTLIIRSGLGISIVPRSMARWGLNGVVLRRIQGFRAKARTVIIYSEGCQNPGVTAFTSLF